MNTNIAMTTTVPAANTNIITTIVTATIADAATNVTNIPAHVTAEKTATKLKKNFCFPEFARLFLRSVLFRF